MIGDALGAFGSLGLGLLRDDEAARCYSNALRVGQSSQMALAAAAGTMSPTAAQELQCAAFNDAVNRQRKAAAEALYQRALCAGQRVTIPRAHGPCEGCGASERHNARCAYCGRQ